VGGAYYLGYVNPATPSNPSAEVFYINYLRLLNAGEMETGVNPPPNPPNTEYTFSRVESTLAGPFAPAILAGASTGNSPMTPITSVAGFYYLIAKYGTTAHVWVVSGLAGSIEIPLSLGQGGGLSHWSLYRVTNGVPDGGATLGLLGLAMLGLGFIRQRMA